MKRGAAPLGVQRDAKAVIARIEASQVPDRGGLDGLSIPQMMQLLGVPGVSMAAHAAYAHDEQGHRMSAPWHIYPEQAAAGLWTTPADLAQFVIEVQLAVRGNKGRVLTSASAREMVAPVGIGPFAVGLMIEKRGEGWYFSHGGSNWGFCADILGHVRKGYGIVVMTNSDAGMPLITEIESRVAAAYGWDSLDKPLVR